LRYGAGLAGADGARWLGDCCERCRRAGCNSGGALGQAGLARCLADGQWGLEAGLAGGVGT